MDYYAMDQLKKFRDSTQLEDYKLLIDKPYQFQKNQFFLFAIYKTEIIVQGVKTIKHLKIGLKN